MQMHYTAKLSNFSFYNTSSSPAGQCMLYSSINSYQIKYVAIHKLELSLARKTPAVVPRLTTPIYCSDVV